MVDEVKLSAVLSELANTLATDFPIQSILDHLVERIVGVLPVTSAGVTLIDPGSKPHYIAASDDTARRFEQLQTDLGEGPCLLAYESGQPVAVPDLRLDDRFPQFASAGVQAGLAAVFTFPLRHRDERFGALDLYRETPGGLSSHAMDAAQTLANVAGAYLLNAEARRAASVRTERLRHVALHDALTGLPNRLLLQERIAQASKRAQRSGAYAAILFIDLDRFKHVNDTHGHQVGDRLLRAVALRLSRLVRPGDTLARVYGDEFVLLCEDLWDRSEVEVIADRVNAAFVKPFDTGSIKLAVTASIGVAYAGPGEQVNEGLVNQADSAMYDVKRSGARTQVVDLRDVVQHGETGRLSRDLRAACEGDGTGDLRVTFQPIVRCADGLLTGAEALLRWHHPERGHVPATSIVTLAEHSGLIERVGMWVLSQASEHAVRWRRAHPDLALDIAVNVSAQQLTVLSFVDDVRQVLVATGMDPSALVLEVTENVLIEDSDAAMAVLTDLKALGIRVALDDFGTGYSSLSYLHRLPIDILKIDRSFVANIDRVAKGAAIVSAVTNLAHALDLLVVTEGVETETQRAAVSEIGVDCAQGYLYSRPLEAAAFGSLLAAGTDGLRLPTLEPAR